MLRRFALSALTGLVLALIGATPASAAGGIEVSHDGVSYSSTLTAALFDGQPQLVPQQARSQTFWVRNATDDDAYLTLMLDSPTWSSVPYGAALTVAASVPGQEGVPLPLASTSGCLVLLEGRVLAAGQAVAVTATLMLGDLGGTIGQNAHATMNVGVVLTETAGLDAAASCATPTVFVPVIAAPSASGGTAGGAATPESTPAIAPDSSAAPADPLGPLGPLGLVLANTLGSFDGSVVGLAAIAVPVGAAVYFVAGLLRRRRPDDDWEETTP